MKSSRSKDCALFNLKDRSFLSKFVFESSFNESDSELEDSFFLLSATVVSSSFDSDSSVSEREESNTSLNEELDFVEEESEVEEDEDERETCFRFCCRLFFFFFVSSSTKRISTSSDSTNSCKSLIKAWLLSDKRNSFFKDLFSSFEDASSIADVKDSSLSVTEAVLNKKQKNWAKTFAYLSIVDKFCVALKLLIRMLFNSKLFNTLRCCLDMYWTCERLVWRSCLICKESAKRMCSDVLSADCTKVFTKE